MGGVIIKQELPINGQIKEKEVQLIGANGEKLGTMSLDEALDIADEQNLDVVLVSPNATPVVCKLMNYGKYKFEQAKKEKESRKNQKAFDIKEIRVSYNIGEHDFNFKSKNARNFLEAGNEDILNKFAESLSDIAVVEKKPFLEGKNMFTILSKKN